MSTETTGPLCATPAASSAMFRGGRQSERWRAWVHAGTGSEDRGNCVATVYMGGRAGTLNTRESVDAMAALLAAAPELADALRTLLPLARAAGRTLEEEHAAIDGAPRCVYAASREKLGAAWDAIEDASALLSRLALHSLGAG